MDKQKQIKNSMTYLIPTIVDCLLPILTLPIFTRILLPKDYGILALAQIYAVFACGVMNLGLLGIYDRSFFQHRDNKSESGKLFFSIILFVFFNYVLLVGVTFFLKSLFAQWFIQAAEFGNILLVTFCAEGIIIIRQYYLFFFKNSEEAKKYVRFYVASSILTFLFSFYLVVFARIGIIGIVYGRLISNSIVLIVLHLNLLKRLPFQFDMAYLINALKISLPLTPTIFSSVLSKHLDKYMIGILASIGGVGIYSMGQRIANMLFMFMTSLQNVFQPQVYKRMFSESKEMRSSVGEYLFPFLYICMLAGLLLSCFTEEIMWVLVAPAYHGAIDIGIILTMYYGFLFWNKINSAQLLYKKKTWAISFLVYLGIILNAAVSIPLIIQWGIPGAAWGTLISGLLTAGVWFMLAQKYFKIDYQYNKLCAIFGLLFVCSLTILLMRYFGYSYALRFGVKLMFLSAYGYLGIQWRIITMENFTLMKNIFKGKILPSTAG